LEAKNIMLEIKIDQEYKIVSDDRNFTLQKKRIITGENTKGRQVNPENIGKEVWEDEGYYRTIKQLIEDYARVKTLKSNAKTFQELFNVLNEIKKLIAKLPDVDNLIKNK
jgi:hypothetical protein